MKILFLAPYPHGHAPSQRFRFELFLKFMEENEMPYDFQSFLSEKGWHVLYQPGHQLAKISAVCSGFVRRFLMLFRLSRYSHVFIHRELAPFGPPVFEWLIAKVFRKKIIYDYDDAIWMGDQNHENPIWKWLKHRHKVDKTCSWSWKVTAGNAYLARYAQSHGANSVIFPTVVDTTTHLPSSNKNSLPTIGWTGSHSTLFYLESILPALKSLAKTHTFRFLVIANKDPKLDLPNYEFVKWSPENEVTTLQQMDIGVMPLEDTEWAKGKCGFKLIQYLAVGIPAVASPVGVNDQVVLHGKNGFLASSEIQWEEYLRKLLFEPKLREVMGAQGRQHIVEHYSVASQKAKFLSLFDG
ncbi:glycosyltransferase [Marinoscillum furvescens]|uniref:Glycosyltransferase involved in cell wall biosynthesis n=1 Tax=Marinoscillum furvescens DSM 4134 TaxID=1122208 RepID=A0A3D9L6C6_MARFU|nr:glycosyltransferase [Marinoscillum furvescens]RED99561.1 glycosyltransferase involved in cell wall biosynthesis [Marinoscillum furvescens DSM 4134]